MVHGGVRIEWSAVPASVRSAVEAQLGSSVTEAVTQHGGFSPGVAVRCSLADGRRCFIKAISSNPNPVSPHFHRREANVAAQLPDDLPVPRLWSVYDDDEWVVLVFEEVEGDHPPMPWTMDSLRATFATLDEVGRVPPPVGIPTFHDVYAPILVGYRELAGGPIPDTLDGWTAAHLDELATIEVQWPEAAAGAGLLHTDVRADNLLVRDDGRVVLVDWPHACVGAAWIDKLAMLPSVGLDGPEPQDVIAALNPFDGVDGDILTTMLVALTGYFEYQGLQPDPPGMPTLRQFQRDQGVAGRTWLQTRL